MLHLENPTALIEKMGELGISKAFFLTLNNQLISSHSELDDLKNFIQNSPDYKNHEGIFIAADQETKCLFGAFVHNTARGAGQGGTRLKQYPTVADILTDGMRLAEGMSNKNACAEIWWGGGKGVIYSSVPPKELTGKTRAKAFANYGKFVASLNGCYITAEDMNTTPEDMRIIHANNRFCTCIPSEIGGSSNPSRFTARGVFQGLLAAFHQVYGKDASLKNRTILLQGAGNVGLPLLEELVKHEAKVLVFELNPSTKKYLQENYNSNQVEIIEDYDLFMQTEADILSPNAIGGTINSETIPKLNVKIIAGGANNQLKFPETDSIALHEKGILYAPDYFINCMGIINCANEQYGYLLSTIESEITKVYSRTLDLLAQAEKEKISPYFAAQKLAEKNLKKTHPIWGHRGLEIIKQISLDGF